MAMKSMNDTISILNDVDENKKKPLIESALSKLEFLLEEPEEKIHKHIWENVFLLDKNYQEAFFINKMPLGNEHITDFVVFGRRHYSNSLAIHVTLIEIERADKKLFTKAGDPSAFLTHAVRQVQDWKTWLFKQGNSEYFKKSLTKKLYESTAGETKINGMYTDHIAEALTKYYVKFSFLIIAGRRQTMNISQRIRLDEMNDNLGHIQIITYDALMEGWLHEINDLTRRGN